MKLSRHFSQKHVGKRKYLLPIIFILDILAVGLIIFLLTRTTDDLTIIKDFANIQGLTDNYYRSNRKLPESLGELNYKTAKDYEYRISGEGTYQLCTTFNNDVSDEVISQSSLSVSYKKGYDCITFNTIANVEGSAVIKRDHNLIPVNASFAIQPSEGVVQGNLHYSINTKQSHFYKDKTTGDYIANLYLSILGNLECTNTTSINKSQCCYSWNSITASTANGIGIQYNRLGTADYIIPYANNETDTYGDLPMNFCMAGTKQINGGMSLVIPAKTLVNGEVTFSLKINEDISTITPLIIKISTTK